MPGNAEKDFDETMIAKTRKDKSKNVSSSRHRQRADHLLAETIKFIPNEMYETPHAERLIESMRPVSTANSQPERLRPSIGIPAYLADLYRFPLLSKHNERYLFCRMNYEKFQADRLRHKLKPARPDGKLLDQIERFLEAALQLRNRIAQSNLRLVVSIAKKYVEPADTLEELVSEGNLALLNAVDAFDFARGFRFSTYASHAIRNRLSRRRCCQQKRVRPVALAEQFALDAIPDNSADQHSSEELFQRRRAIVSALLGSLAERDRFIISRRFGLDGHAGPHTFSQIGCDLGLSKERVRQLAVRAIAALQERAENDGPLITDFNN